MIEKFKGLRADSSGIVLEQELPLSANSEEFLKTPEAKHKIEKFITDPESFKSPMFETLLKISKFKWANLYNDSEIPKTYTPDKKYLLSGEGGEDKLELDPAHLSEFVWQNTPKSHMHFIEGNDVGPDFLFHKEMGVVGYESHDETYYNDTLGGDVQDSTLAYYVDSRGDAIIKFLPEHNLASEDVTQAIFKYKKDTNSIETLRYYKSPIEGHGVPLEDITKLFENLGIDMKDVDLTTR